MTSATDFAGIQTSDTLLHLRGADIAGFLQGQLTCDTRPLAADRSVSGALCNVRGRVLADLLILFIDETHCLLRLRRDIAAQTADTLALYARFSRIDVTVDDGGYRILVGRGAVFEEHLAGLALDAPEAVGAVTGRNGLRCLRSVDSCCELIIPPSEAAAAAIGTDDRGEADRRWRALQLAAGRYRIETPDAGEFTPQALNYDLAGQVSFSKGCYTGQEVVARLHYKGQSKRRLAVLRIAAPGAAAPARGAALLDEAGVAQGQLLRCEALDDGHWLCAAMLRADADPATALRLDGDAPPAQRLVLPYDSAS